MAELSQSDVPLHENIKIVIFLKINLESIKKNCRLSEKYLHLLLRQSGSVEE